MSRTRLCAPSQPTRYRAVTRYCPSDPHEPPDQVNDRARDLVDLLLIRETFYRDGTDLAALRAACVDVFAARAVDAQSLGLPVRTWPPTLHAHDHWQTDFTAANADVDLTLETAVDLVTSWIQQIDAARPPDAISTRRPLAVAPRVERSVVRAQPRFMWTAGQAGL